jgi:hypothetical protein
LAAQGKLDEAVAAYRQAIGMKPDFSQAFSGLLFGLNYDDKLTNDYLFAAHREWDDDMVSGFRRLPRTTTIATQRGG